MSTNRIHTRSEADTGSSSRWRSLLADRVHGGAARATAVARILAGLFFVLVSIPKFPFAGAAHRDEMTEFVRYGFPHSTAIVVLVGLLELLGGLMLVFGIGTRLAAFGLAVNMAGAIATAGIKVGGPFHLGVAPALLITMIFLVWSGAGSSALDHRLGGRRQQTS